MHVVLGDDDVLAGFFQRRVTRDVIRRDNNAAGVNGQMTRKVADAVGDVQDFAVHVQIGPQGAQFGQGLQGFLQLADVAVRQVFGYFGNFIFRDAEGFGHVADGRPVLEGVEGADHGGAFGAVFFVHVTQHAVAALPADVQVDVGRVAALGIEKTLEIQVVPDGVHLGDFQHVRHQTVRRRTAAHAGDVFPTAKVGNILDDQKIFRKTQIVDGLQLVFQPFGHPAGERLVAFHRAFETLLPQVRKTGFAGRQFHGRKDRPAQPEGKVTFGGDFFRVGQRFGKGAQ